MAFDVNNSVDLLALKNEVYDDPNIYGYNPDSTYIGVLNIINLKRDDITVSNQTIPAISIKDETYFDAYDHLGIDEQEWLVWKTDTDSPIKVTQDLRDRLTGTLGGGSTGDSIWAAADDDVMEPAMLALIDVDGSRAEELFGQGTSISQGDWIAAKES